MDVILHPKLKIKSKYMAENEEPKVEPQKSKRELVMERLTAKYPDRQYTDDEALLGQVNDDYDEYERQLGEYRDREAKLDEVLAKDPRSAQFFVDMVNGENPMVSMVRRVGIDGMTDLINDPEKQEAYAEANKEFLERLAKGKELNEQYKANIAESVAMLDALQQERGLTDEVVDAAMDLVTKMANEAIIGKYSRETVEMALKAIGHDAAVENARSEGEIAGRNAKIEETLRTPQTGDGLPAMGGSSQSPAKRVNRSIFDVANGAE